MSESFNVISSFNLMFKHLKDGDIISYLFSTYIESFRIY